MDTVTPVRAILLAFLLAVFVIWLIGRPRSSTGEQHKKRNEKLYKQAVADSHEYARKVAGDTDAKLRPEYEHVVGPE